MSRTALVGRTPELARLLSSYRDLRTRGVLVTGGSGVGKTRLVREFARIITSKEHPIFYLCDRSMESSEVVLDLRAPPRTQTRNATRAFTVVVDEDSIRHQTSADISASLDASRERDAFSVFCFRSRRSVPAFLEPFLDMPALDVIHVDPLSVSETHQLVEQVLDGPADLDLLSAVFELSQGVPGITLDVLGCGVSRGTIVRGQETWLLAGSLAPSDTMVHDLLQSVQQLSEEERRGLEILALAGGMVWEVLVPIVGHECLDCLESSGFVDVREEEGRDTIELSSPLVATLVRNEMKPGRRRLLATRLLEGARECDGGLESGNPLTLLSLFDAARIEPQALLVRRAAMAALGTGHLEVAESLAIRLTRSESDLEAAFLLATVTAARGRSDAALAVLEDLEATEDEDQVAEIVTRKAEILFDAGDGEKAVALLDGVEKELEAREAQARVQTARLKLCGYTRDWAGALSISGRLLGDKTVSAGVRDRAETMCLVVASMTGPVEPHEATVRQLLRRLTRVRDDLDFWQLYAVYSFGTYGGLLREVTPCLLSAFDDLMRNAPHNPFCGAVAVGAGAIQQYRGLLRESRESLRFACRALQKADPIGFYQLTLTRLAVTCGMAGDREGMEECLDLLDEPEVRLSSSTTARARAWYLVLEGRLAAAAELMASAAMSSMAEEAVLAWPLMLLHDAVRIGFPDAVLEPLGELRQMYGGMFAATAADHAKALANRQPSELLAVSRRFEELGYQLYAAEAAGQAAAILSEEELRRPAQAALQLTSRLAGHCTQAATPALAVRPRSLSERELEIAQMAAAGTTSRDIAETLCISVRTVDNHLGSVYAKLGVDGRHGLGVALEDLGSVPKVEPPGSVRL